MIGGVFGVVKGGFSGIRRRTQEGGIPAYAGMTGGGVGYGVMGGGIWRDGCGYVDGGMTGDSRLRGNDEEGAGMVGWGV